MSMHKRRFVVGALAVVLLAGAYAAPGPRADIHILTAEKSDANPQRLQAAVDMGWMAISVLVTWTKRFAQ
jgi:hypothetical protein